MYPCGWLPTQRGIVDRDREKKLSCRQMLLYSATRAAVRKKGIIFVLGGGVHN